MAEPAGSFRGDGLSVDPNEKALIQPSTSSDVIGSGSGSAELSGSSLVALHLVPGGLAVVVYLSLISPMGEIGFPPLAALLAAIILVILPLELGVIAYAGRRQAPSGLFGAVLYRNSVPRRLWWTLAPLLIVVGVAASALGMLVERPLLDLLGGLLPQWLVDPVATDAMRDYDTSVWVVTLTVYFVVNVLLGPVVEEMYFRGYLLPRMRRFGRWAPLLNTVLFSLYHFWSPAQLVSRIGGAAPYVYAVERNRSIYLGIVIHVALNAISVATLTVIVFSNLS